MTLKTLFCCLALLAAVDTFSQDSISAKIDGNDVSFLVVEHDPAKFNKLWIGPDLFSLNLGYSFCFGAGIDANYFHTENLWIKGNFFYPYFDSQVMETPDKYFEEGTKKRPAVHADLGATYYFKINRNLDEEATITLDISSNGDVTTIQKLKVPIPTDVKFGARFGYFYNQQFLGGLGTGDSVLVVTEDSGTNLYEINFQSYTSHALYFGISRTEVKNFVIKSAPYGTNTNKRYRHYYLDALVGLGGDMSFGAFFSPHEYTPDFGWKRLGVRIGAERTIKGRYKNFGVKMGVEYALRPIPAAPALTESVFNAGYFSFKLGLHFVSNTVF